MSAADGGSSVDVEVDPITAASKQTKPNDSKIGTLEKIFSVLTIDKSLSLLAAILPQELSVSFQELVIVVEESQQIEASCTYSIVYLFHAGLHTECGSPGISHP